MIMGQEDSISSGTNISFAGNMSSVGNMSFASLISSVRLDEEDISEICRYAGYGSYIPDGDDMIRIKRCMELINAASSPRWIYQRIDRADEKKLYFLEGNDIKAHIKGCREVILMAVTTGAGVDNAIRKAGYQDVADQLMADASATTLTEKCCDIAEGMLRKSLLDEGMYLTGRYSPGYGDMPIECQRGFTSVLDTARKIGLTLSSSGVMIPSKSVTAVMGISHSAGKGRPSGCSECLLKENCFLRRQGTPCATRKKKSET